MITRMIVKMEARTKHQMMQKTAQKIVQRIVLTNLEARIKTQAKIVQNREKGAGAPFFYVINN